jgi:retinol dehydrogenase-12
LAQRGARVILACRNIAKGETAAEDIRNTTRNSQVFVEELDLASFESINEFAKRINQNEEQVNILINNAGSVCSLAYFQSLKKFLFSLNFEFL